MDPRIREFRMQRAALVRQAREMLDKADEESRDLTNDEEAEYRNLLAQTESLEKKIARREKLVGKEQDLEQPEQRGLHPDPEDDPSIGMDERDLERYSLVRALAAQDAARRGDPHAWDNAGLELEASRAAAQRMGREPEGFFVPYDWASRSLRSLRPRETRDMQVGDPIYGGYMVSEDLLAQSFIDMLRNRALVQRAGATMLTGLVGDVDIPKQSSGATAYWVGEGGAPTESTPQLGQVKLRPRTCGGYTDVTRRLLKQASIDMEIFVRTELAAVIALAIDYAALHGSGSANQPLGLQYVSGIGSVVGGTNGAAPDWSDIVSLETEVAQDNADVGRLAYMTNAKVRGKLKATMRTATYGDIPIWNDMAGNTPLNGYACWVTNQVRSDLTKGSSDVCSALFFGNWADLLIGMWGGLDVLVDPYTNSTSGTVRVVAMQDVDVQVRHAESFAAMLDALTA